MKSPSLAVIAESKYYRDYRDRCAEHLREFGWRADAHEDFSGTRDYDGLLVIGIHFYRWPPFVPGQFRAGLQGEQLPLPGDRDWSLHRNLKRFRALAGNYDLVIEWSPANFIHTPCKVPYAYLPFGAPVPTGLPKSEDWDVLFLGNPYGGKGRRQAVLQALRENCHLCPIVEAWGEKKYQLIHSAKISLNLHQFESASFESPRFFELLTEGAFVLSERIENSFPFEDGRDYVSFTTIDELIEKVHFYRSKPDERRRIADAGRNTAQAYPEKEMFARLALELQRCSLQLRNPALRRIRWTKSRTANLMIELVDAAAAAKRKIFSKMAPG